MGVTTTPPRPGNDFVDRKNEENGERLEQQEQLDNVQLQPTDSRIQEQQIQAQQDRFDGENLEESRDGVAPINDPTLQQRQNNDRVLKGKIIVSRDGREAMLIRPIDTREHQNLILNKESPRHTIFYRDGRKIELFHPIDTWEDQIRPRDEKSERLHRIHVNAKVVDTWKNVPKGEKRFKCSAPGCKNSGKYKTNVQTHVSRFTGERLYACAFCPKLFPGQKNRNDHEETHSEIKKEWKCTFVDEKGKECGKITHGATHKGRVEHQEIVHGGTKMPCDDCGRNLVYYPGQDPEEVKKAHLSECKRRPENKMKSPEEANAGQKPPKRMKTGGASAVQSGVPPPNYQQDESNKKLVIHDPPQDDNQEVESIEVDDVEEYSPAYDQEDRPIEMSAPPRAPPRIKYELIGMIPVYKKRVIHDPPHYDNEEVESIEDNVAVGSSPADDQENGYSVSVPVPGGQEYGFNGVVENNVTFFTGGYPENGLIEDHEYDHPQTGDEEYGSNEDNGPIHYLEDHSNENLDSPVDDQENGSTMSLLDDQEVGFKRAAGVYEPFYTGDYRKYLNNEDNDSLLSSYQEMSSASSMDRRDHRESWEYWK